MRKWIGLSILTVWFVIDGDVRKEKRIRIGKAGAVFARMKKVWNYRGLSLKFKENLFFVPMKLRYVLAVQANNACCAFVVTDLSEQVIK